MEGLAKIIEALRKYQNLEKKMQKVKRKMEVLESIEADVNEELEYAESLSLKKRRKEVESWLTNVQILRSEVHTIEERVCEARWQERLRLYEGIDKIGAEAEELIMNGGFPQGLLLQAREINGDALLTTRMVGQMFERNLYLIREWLSDDDITTIAAYGMGGVGKTTLVTHVHNQLLDNPGFFVSWVTVSQNSSVYKLQHDIAKTMGLDLSMEDDERKRAAKLAHALLRRGSSVLILDDVWDYFPLEKVRIPVDKSRCRLILTTRSLEVCRKMGCQKKIKVQPLSDEEAWDLFCGNLEHGTALDPEIVKIAKLVARECAGLPLGIITMAGSMRGVNDVCEWTNTLENMKDARWEPGDFDRDIFQVLSYSYTRLEDPKLKQCFLYCALYPEDHEIKREELIEQFIDEGLITGMNSRRAEFNRGHTILNKLENVCLLQGIYHSPYNMKLIKMHDLVRVMAIQIANTTNPRVLVESGMTLTEIPNENKWENGLVRVSLMHNKISDIPQSTSPRCPDLSTLLLQDNKIKHIPDCFFLHMNTLSVLDLSYNPLESLPDSISNMISLTALLLKGCGRLKHVPSLTKLKALRKLNLHNTGIMEIPQGTEKLINLRYLNLETSTLESLPDGTFCNLSLLQYLVVNWHSPHALKVNGQELTSLRKLETLKCQFHDVDDFNTYVKSWEDRRPSNYLIQVGSGNDTYYEDGQYNKGIILMDCKLCESTSGENSIMLPKEMDSLSLEQCQDATSLCNVALLHNIMELKSCIIRSCNQIEHLVYPSSGHTLPFLRKLEILHLYSLINLQGICVGDRPIQACTFSSLRQFRIHGCPNLKKLFTPNLMPSLRNLEQIRIDDCDQLEEIIAGSTDVREENNQYKTEIVFPKLNFLNLLYLPELKSICSPRSFLVCNSLQAIEVKRCPKLKRIPLLDEKLTAPPSLQWIAAQEEWWESLEWDSPEAKIVLQPFVAFSQCSLMFMRY